MTTTTPRLGARGFALLAAAVIAVEWAVARAPSLQHVRLVPFAVLVDLVVVLPLVFALAVLRPAGRPLLDASWVFALGAFVAGALLASRPAVHAPLVVVGATSEVLVVRRVRAVARHEGPRSDDFLLRMQALPDVLSRAVGAELAVFFYALLGPRIRRAPRPGEFAYTETSGFGGVLLMLGIVAVSEGVAVHLLLAQYAPRAAWLHLAINAYGLLWLVAAHQAARLRPVLVTADTLLVRASLFWTAAVPRAAIASVTDVVEAPLGPGVLKAALGTPPVLLVTLSAPVEARGLMGLRRSVTRIALHVDDPAGLRAALGLRA
jgi:hypothetical protein